MATSYFPFDAGAGSAITEGSWQKMARRWLGTGVCKGYLNELAVTADGSGMTVSVATGGAWVEGFYFESDAAAAQTITASHATLGRIDYVVVELDRTANTIAFKVVAGTADASPVAPSLTQTDALWQMPLATVTVDAAVGVIAADKVTDARQFDGPRSPTTITASGASVIPLTLKGAASQTANLLEAQNSAGVALASVNSGGDLVAAGVTTAGDVVANNVQLGGSGWYGSTANVLARSTGEKGLVVRGNAGQSANLAEFQNSAATVLTAIDASGAIRSSGDIAHALGSTESLGRLTIGTANTAAAGLVVKGVAGQTRNIVEVQDSGGTVVGGFDAAGAVIGVHGGATGSILGYMHVNIGGISRRVPYYEAL